jgi:DNA-binding IclR family transcriptional regulator
MNPLYCTALGKVLLAFGDVEIPDRLEQFTPRTIKNKKVLREHLQKVRKMGYAVDDEEFDPGVRCIAVPVFDFRDKVVGAIGISGPSTRITQERLPRLAGIVIEVGKEVSERMTFSP